ncbi:unnamed protein product [Meloidogyne enterolobii]|uniref:Uncharacterized protein n=1 Tax=Meloidogyne enterolobii TaxID=390850 RepID=A0ACB1AG53_MELEN
MKFLTFFILIYYFVELISTSRDFLKTEEYEQFVGKERGELLEMYKKYFGKNHEGIDDEIFQELQIRSFNIYFELFLENVAGKFAENGDNEETIFIKLMIENNEEDESKKIKNENFGWNDEFGSSFKKLNKDALNLLEELFKNDNWSLEKKFCEIYSLVEFAAKNEELSKNNHWSDYIIKFNYVSIIYIYREC